MSAASIAWTLTVCEPSLARRSSLATSRAPSRRRRGCTKSSTPARLRRSRRPRPSCSRGPTFAPPASDPVCRSRRPRAPRSMRTVGEPQIGRRRRATRERASVEAALEASRLVRREGERGVAGGGHAARPRLDGGVGRRVDRPRIGTCQRSRCRRSRTPRSCGNRPAAPSRCAGRRTRRSRRESSRHSNRAAGAVDSNRKVATRDPLGLLGVGGLIVVSGPVPLRHGEQVGATVRRRGHAQPPACHRPRGRRAARSVRTASLDAGSRSRAFRERREGG